MRSTKRPPTLDDVAKLAGVSTATVSRSLSAPAQVAKFTRKRVERAIEKLGYTPNFGARVMAAKRTYTIGCIIPTMENAIFARGLQSFQNRLNDHGYTLLVASSAYDPEREEAQIRALVARGADGLLLIGHDRDKKIHQYLRKQRVPALTAWSYEENAALASVGFDNRQAIRELTLEVLKAGHRRFAVISGITHGNDRARHRLEGIKETLIAHGLPPSRLQVIETDYGIEEGGSAFAELFSGHEAPSVVMCGNDVLAVGAMLEARRLGLEVPQDVSITGFDDIELARTALPALTTVHVPHRKMGSLAATELVRMVETGSAGRSVKLQTTLCQRGTLGPPNL